MTSNLDPVKAAAVLDAQSALLGVPIAPEHRAGVVNYLMLAAGLAQPMLKRAAALSTVDESGSVFRPVVPKRGSDSHPPAHAPSALSEATQDDAIETTLVGSQHPVGASAAQQVQAALSRIQATDQKVNAFTAVLADRARQRAVLVDSST
ncbi:MAG: AtzG-like protein, partial [Betaproteobacteria bacterium]